jgi:hypothetical protein
MLSMLAMSAVPHKRVVQTTLMLNTDLDENDKKRLDFDKNPKMSLDEFDIRLSLNCYCLLPSLEFFFFWLIFVIPGHSAAFLPALDVWATSSQVPRVGSRCERGCKCSRSKMRNEGAAECAGNDEGVQGETNTKINQNPIMI